MVVMAPADENECRQMLTTGYRLDGPSAVRYPRGSGPGVAPQKAFSTLPVGKAEVRRKGKRIAILAFGSMVKPALEAGEQLDATVVNMRFVKPLDAALVAEMAATHELIVTVEEHQIMGGAGSAVLEALATANVRALLLGLPDRFIDHGDTAKLLSSVGLDADGICRSIRAAIPE
jgi:1-deoxy-D-xylulose-5-phosphate synthase